MEELKSLHKLTPDAPLSELHRAVQQAIEIEITTIPLYLYTYYSIRRVPKQDNIISYYTKKLMDSGKTEQEACQIAKAFSVEIMVFANKAAATIMSVAVEEMLHMALSSNLQRGLGAMPQLVGRAPKKFPTILPGHAQVNGQDFSAPLAPLSLEQLDVFIKIEQPEKLDPDALYSTNVPFDYTSIGEFYHSIENYIKKNAATLVFDTTSPQIYPDEAYNRNGYYAPNNVNTIYYDKDHKPQFMNANRTESSDHSGHLVKVVDVKTACEAIDEIVEQGEGAGGQTPNCDAAKKDPNHEESHYEKFVCLKNELGDYKKRLAEMLGIKADDEEKDEKIKKAYDDLLSFFVHPIPTNPQTSDYPADLRALSNYVNALYTYHFHMTQACYRFDNPKQGAIMLYGLHKSMFFILSVVCSFMIEQTYTDSSGKIHRVAPTFEEYQFKPGQSVKAQLIELNKLVPDSLGMTPNQLARISDLPDIDIVPMENMRF